MPGPAPKPAALRQRRNKSASRTVLQADVAQRPSRRRPRLPNCPNAGSWHQMARRWWVDVWESPMAAEFLSGDLPALFRLVTLVDVYWKLGSLDVAREIRLMEREFGLTPLSRRRLEWSVVQAEESKDKYHRRRVKEATVIDGDPRDILGD